MTAGEPASAAVELPNGARLTIRPVRADDAERMEAFHANLSSRSVHHRYFHQTSLEHRVAQAKRALGAAAPGSVAAFVAEHTASSGERAIVAHGRLTWTSPPGSAEVALVVVDAWQGLGVGTAMMAAVVAEARRLGVRRVIGDMLADNDAMRAVVRRAGFVLRSLPGDAGLVRAELCLAP